MDVNAMVHATGARGAARSRAACPASPDHGRPTMFSKTLTRRLLLAAAFVLAAALAIPVFSATAPRAAAASQPCDIYASGGTPCEAAYSTTRALFARL